MDSATQTIYKGILSVKFMNENISQRLYELRDTQFDSFIDFLKINPCNTRQTEILIKLGFFNEFGKSLKLLTLYEFFNKIYGRKQFSKNNLPCDQDVISRYSIETEKGYKNIDACELLRDLSDTIPDENMPLNDFLLTQLEYTGTISYSNVKYNNCYLIVDINLNYSPKIFAYNLATGSSEKFKLKMFDYQKNSFDKRDILKITLFEKKQSVTKKGGKWVLIENQFDLWIKEYEKLSNSRNFKKGET